MSKNSLRLLFIITFLRTGISNNSIYIKHRMEGERLILTCDLSGNEKLTQVNWQIQWPNSTIVGIFHPVHGTYIPPEYADSMSIECKHLWSSASFALDKIPLNETIQICCTFMTFPSGHLMKCTKIADSDGVSANNRKTEAKKGGRERGLFGQLGALTVGCLLSLVLFIAPVYMCHKCFCRRRQEFRVQQAHYTEPQESSETSTEDARDERHVPPPPGFEPAKLYAKIKKDIYYGRLWKSYQGRARVSTQGSPHGTKKIYYRIGERPVPQRDEEDKPMAPDKAVT